MLKLSRRRKRAQSLVIVALSATALFGIIALGLDAGRLYFQRRDVQNAADAAALAGAQELLPKDGNTPVTNGMQAAANCQAAYYGLVGLNDSPQDSGCTPNPNPAYSPNGSGFITEPAKNIAASVTVWTPSNGFTNQIHVRVSYSVPLTFASVIGFTQSTVVADAYAHGGFYNNQYSVFGFQAGPGGGNTVQYEQDGNAQIDNGLSGSDMCGPNPNQGRMVSNSKWHAPNPNGGKLSINGIFQHLSAADTHAVTTYWYYPVNPVAVQEQAPNYEASVTPPDASPGWTDISSYSGAYGTRPAHRIRAGTWHSNLSIPFASDRNGTDYYIFDNGLYLFDNANFTITGGVVSNTSDGAPHMANVGPGSFIGGVTTLPPAADGTDGVEFIFDHNASFSATNPSGGSAKAPSVFLVAPTHSHTPGKVTDSIAFFIRQTDTNLSPWTERIDGTKATAAGYPFQIWGTVFDAEPYATSTIQATSAWLSAASQGTYAVTGEFIAARVDLWGGNLTSGAITQSNPGPPCVYNQNPAGLLVQYNANYAPHFRGYAYLIK